LCIAPPRHVNTSTVVYGASRVVHVAAGVDRVAAQLRVACCAEVASSLVAAYCSGAAVHGPLPSRVCVQCSQLRAAGSTPPLCYSTVADARNGGRRSYTYVLVHKASIYFSFVGSSAAPSAENEELGRTKQHTPQMASHRCAAVHPVPHGSPQVHR
jgi:hypothetical protein